MRKLILWDIDGTLLRDGGLSGELIRAAMQKTYGDLDEAARVSYAGKTDRQIILETFPEQPMEQLFGRLDQFTRTYVAMFEARRDELLTRGRVLDGVVAALESLTTHDVVQSVLTGNIEPIAHLKIATWGLTHFLDLAVGAYGNDHERRIELVPIAQRRASQHYHHLFSGHDIVVVGDTPNDIACGREVGARTVAVASGSFSIDDLRAHKPDVLLPNLVDTEAVVKAMM